MPDHCVQDCGADIDPGCKEIRHQEMYGRVRPCPIPQIAHPRVNEGWGSGKNNTKNWLLLAILIALLAWFLFSRMSV